MNGGGTEIPSVLTLEQETNSAAQKIFEPRSSPDGFVAEHQNWITTRTPAERAEQNRVEQADVVADQKITLIPPQAIQAVGAAQVRQGKEAVRALTEQRLDEHQPSRDAQMV